MTDLLDQVGDSGAQDGQHYERQRALDVGW
jgi:hypothetical protein